MKCAQCKGNSVLCVFCGKPPGLSEDDCNCGLEFLMDHEATHGDCLKACPGCKGRGDDSLSAPQWLVNWRQR